MEQKINFYKAKLQNASENNLKLDKHHLRSFPDRINEFKVNTQNFSSIEKKQPRDLELSLKTQKAESKKILILNLKLLN
jgi:hypothetical protein